jgi:N-carbamoyl-L-amino-acid hydrolase
LVDGSVPPAASGPRVDGARLNARLAELASIGATAGGGVTRLAYSPEDVRGRNLVAGWMAEAGLRTHTDAAGNLIGVLPGVGPVRPGPGPGGVHAVRSGRGGHGAIATGSHLDTVVDAGALDGAYGAVAAVEVADALRRSGLTLRHDLVVVGFSNEEGARGTPGMVGSRAIAGAFDPALLAGHDDLGVTLTERLAASGGDPDAVGTAAWEPVAAFLELHIEQGPVLESTGRRIGAVTAITGQRKVDFHITGAANHAGTTPMDLRRDASVAAAHLVLAAERLARDGHVRVATAGLVRAEPGVRNVVPGSALVGVDIRDVDDTKVDEALKSLTEAAGHIAELTKTQIDVRPGPHVPATACDPRLADCFREAADGLGLSRLDLPSGAGHDAQWMSRLGPVGMVFVPSVGGVSHSPHEHTEPEDLTAGADVLLRALVEVDRRL